MYTLNAQYRSQSFQLFGDTTVAQTLRSNMRNGFEDFVQHYKQPVNNTAVQAALDAMD